MFESAELGQSIDKETYEAQVPALREALLVAQNELKAQRRFPVLILINGIEGAGKGETIKLLSEWMDPRMLVVRTFDWPTAEILHHPPAWRYWRELPPKGQIGLFLGNWYSQMLHQRVMGHIDDFELDRQLEDALALEQMLCDEGTLILKFWFHLSKKQMRRRLKTLKNDPLHSWKISPLDWQQSKIYDRFVCFGERVVQRSSRNFAPWYVVDGSDPRYRGLTVARTLLDSLQAALDSHASRVVQPHAAPLIARPDNRRLLDSLDLSLKVDRADYHQQLEEEQGRMSRLMRHKNMRHHALVAGFEGNDAAGKGGAIRRVAEALDPRQYRIVPISAPTDEERAQPYLWRFWRHVPPLGRFTIFDRTWYGRVLVERVEKLIEPDDWLRAYSEINDFEENLVRFGIVLVKFWLAIDKDTQYERFKARENTPYKRFKITDEDWRNRDKWDQYVDAVGDMVDRTSTSFAPWTLVEANDKHFARIKVLRTINDALEKALD